MALYILCVLAAATLLSGGKLALLPRRWRWSLTLPVAVIPFTACGWLLRQNRGQLEQLLGGTPELETLCAVAVTQELCALALGWPLIAGRCRFHRLRLATALAPSLLLIPGVLYAQFSAFLHLPGRSFPVLTGIVALGGWLLPPLLAEIMTRLRSGREDRLRLVLSLEWLTLLLTVALPAAAQCRGLPAEWEMPDPVTWPVWGIIAAGCILFAGAHHLWNVWKGNTI